MVCFIFVFGPCFVVQYLVSVIFSFAIISLGKRERERWLLKNCFNVMGLLGLCVSSSWCNGLVCSV